MLADRDRELLTASVDGELSARQRKAVARLLRRSSDARTLLKRLQEDAAALHHLPRASLSTGFPNRVLSAVAQRGLRPGARRPAPQTVSIWSLVAAAAAVLLSVGLSSFLFFASTLDSGNLPVARGKTDPGTPEKKAEGTVLAPDTHLVKDDPEKIDPKPLVGPEKPKPDPVVKGPGKKEKPAKPTPPERVVKTPLETVPLRGAPTIESVQPDQVDVSIPALFAIRDLGQPSGSKRLQKELSSGNAFYIELLCREGTRAFPRVRAALKGAGVELVVDATAEHFLKNPKWKVNYAFYLEDLTPEDLGRVLARLSSRADTVFDARRPHGGQFAGADANLVVCRMTTDHRKRLTQMLGADPKQVPGKQSRSSGVDLRRPLAEQTAEQVTAALSAGTRTTLARPTAKAPARTGLAVAHSPVPSRPMSAEIKRYLENRKAARKGTLQILLVLRGRP
jgi:hypothetical protein